MSTDSYSALSSKNFRTYLYGNILSVLGVWIQRLALGWHAWQLSESALTVGLVAAAQFLPLILLTAFFGVWVDQVVPMTKVHGARSIPNTHCWSPRSAAPSRSSQPSMRRVMNR